MPSTEELADAFIVQHKTSPNKIFDWRYEIHEKRNEDGYFVSLMAAKNLLLQNGLIERFIKGENFLTKLTSKGEKWVSFKNEHAKIQKQEKYDKRIHWAQRNWLLISIINGLIINLIFEGVKHAFWQDDKSSKSQYLKDGLNVKDSTKPNTSDTITLKNFSPLPIKDSIDH